MTKEEAIEIINRENDPNDKKVWEVFPEYREALEMAIQALSQEPCRKDCRLCKEFDECENGKKGHKNGTSIGYSIGECKDYKPCTDAVSREEAITAIRHAFSWVVPSNPSKEVREIFNKCKENLRELPSVNPQPCDDAISREELLKAIDTWDKFGYTETGCFVRITKEIDNYVPYVHLEDVITAIQKLPPVTQKAGKWIYEEVTRYEEDGDTVKSYADKKCKCSACGHDYGYQRMKDPFCRYCGAKMESEE